VDGLAHRPNFYNYTYLEEMKGDAHLAILKGVCNFNAEKYDNPFAFISKIA
jgi:hypothetical protein